MSPEFHSSSTVRFSVSADSVRVSLTGLRMVPLASIFFIIARRKFCWRAMRSKSPRCSPYRVRTYASAILPSRVCWPAFHWIFWLGS